VNIAIELLQKHWGHASFRPLQGKIVTASMQGQDVFALLPTGGGKSICFQVPALTRKGICLVISPLLALMKDQVKHLHEIGITATYFSSEFSESEINRLFDECIENKHKFVYCSPERLLSRKFRERLNFLKFGSIVIDEAHCISQWGHDFRPAYLEIPKFLKEIPRVPIMAVTATANAHVIKEISSLLFQHEFSFFQDSFRRDNLHYFTLQTSNKNETLLHLCQNLSGCGIVYCPSRKQVDDTLKYLSQNNIEATSYHAGKSVEEKKVAFEKWMSNDKRIMVATNAFGMGIDKPDVRFVIHLQLPTRPEAYFQEAGRAGRDGHKSDVIALYHASDFQLMKEHVLMSYPDKNLIYNVYQQLANMHRVALHTGENEQFQLDLSGLAIRCEMKESQVGNALLLLEQSGYIQIIPRGSFQSKCRVLASRDQLRLLAEQNHMQAEILRTLFRLYGGIWENLTSISEWDIAEASQYSVGETRKLLKELESKQFIDYYIPSEKSHFVYIQPRVEQQYLSIPDEVYSIKQRRELEQIDFMQGYALTAECKENFLLRYFNDQSSPCQQCQSCLLKNEPPSEKTILNRIDQSEQIGHWFASPIPYDKEFVELKIQALIQDGIIELEQGRIKKAK